MKRIPILAATAGAALALAPGAYAAQTLHLATAKGRLKAGAELRLSSTDFTLSGGVAECQSTEIVGKLTRNATKKDTGSLTSARFEGSEAEGACKSAGGPAKLEAAQLPWSLEMPSKESPESAWMKAKKITIVVSYPDASGMPKCTYEAGKLKATPVYNNGSGQATLTLTSQVLRRNKKASASTCSPSTAASGVFLLESDDEAVFGTLVEKEKRHGGGGGGGEGEGEGEGE